jgi:hypothetical protein
LQVGLLRPSAPRNDKTLLAFALIIPRPSAHVVDRDAIEFALVSGEPGSGKSAALRILSDRLSAIQDIMVVDIPAQIPAKFRAL